MSSSGGADTYRFEPVAACVMCGAPDARTLGKRLNVHQGLRPRRVRGVATTVVQCRRCGLIYANPRPVPGNLEQHYERPPEEYWHACWAVLSEDSPEYFGLHADRFRELWCGTRVPRALDVGAGVGRAMSGLQSRGFDTFGFEPSAPFRDRAIANGIDPDRLQLASLEAAEYEPGSFDFVTFSAVLEHLHDPAAALMKAMCWLAPRGLIHVDVPSANWLLSRLLNFAHRARGLDYVTNLSPMHPPYHLYEFTLDSFIEHGRRTSYGVLDHRFYVGVVDHPFSAGVAQRATTFIPRFAGRLANRLMTATDTGMQLEVWLQAA